MAKVTVRLDGAKVYEAIQQGDGTWSLIESVASKIAASANANSAWFRTGIFHDHATGETLGDTQPEFGYNVAKKKRTIVGLVHPKNYAAIKCNHENNTLLKSI